MSQRVVAHLAGVGRAATQAGNSQDGVCRRATGTLVSRQFAECSQDSLLGLVVDQCHCALGESERLEQIVADLDLDVD